MALLRRLRWLPIVVLVGSLGGSLLPTAVVTWADHTPATSHPRLWLTHDDLPRLRAWAGDGNPLYRDGLAVLAETAKADMDAGHVPAGDIGDTNYVDYPSEKYAELFAFLSLVSPDAAARTDYGERARSLLMHAIDEAAKGVADDAPFRDPEFAVMDRSRWYGEGFALTVDWIYPFLTPTDKATIRRVFLRWAEEIVTTGYHHPEPMGVRNDPVLVGDRTAVRWAGNNYFTAHMRNLGLMAMALDPADDPGGELGAYLANATGSWLYMVDDLLRTDAKGGLAPEGFEYSPQSMGYVAQFLLALHTAGQDDPDVWGPQVALAGDPFWDDLVTAYLHSLSPAPVISADGEQVYQPAWYGDGQIYDAPDFIEVFGPLGVYDRAAGNMARLEALRWIEINLPPGGAGGLVDRVGDASAFGHAILYFLLFDPAAAPPADPRPSLPVAFYAPGLGRVFARTGWDEDATWFTYALGWSSIDHQHGDGNQFELYRNGEWLTKERTGYGDNIGSSDYHNTLALENDIPAHVRDDPTDYRRVFWERGSQWLYGLASGDPQIVALSAGPGYVYALGDATPLYNSTYEDATDILHASRSIVWLEPNHVVVYDRATSKTAGRFKRFWLNLPAAATVDGHRAIMPTAAGQQFVVTTLLPTDALVTAELAEPLADPYREPADGEPMQFRLRVEAPGGPADVRFLHVLQGTDAGASADPATAIESQDDRYAGALVAGTVVLFPAELSAVFAGLTYTVPANTSRHLITGLTPDGGYDVAAETVGENLEITITAGSAYRADAGGVLAWGPAVRPEEAAAITSLPTPVQVPTATATSAAVTSVPGETPTGAESTEPAETSGSTPEAAPVTSPGVVPAGTGAVTYRLSDGHVYRIVATDGAVPEDVSVALDAIAPGTGDRWLNVSLDGQWLILETERFDPSCAGYSCLAIVRGDLSAGEAVRANGELVHPSLLGDIAGGGNLIVYPTSGGPHDMDLWAIVRAGDDWSAPLLLTAASPYVWHQQPAISADGHRVVFDCGAQPYGAVGTAICEVATDGTGFRVLLTPADSPPGLPDTGAIRHPDYALDGGIVFQADWAGDQIWRLPPGAAGPIPMLTAFANDTAPCVLPDGRIASLWQGRPGGAGLLELKVMTADGAAYGMLLTGVDVGGVDIGCGGA